MKREGDMDTDNREREREKKKRYLFQKLFSLNVKFLNSKAKACEKSLKSRKQPIPH